MLHIKCLCSTPQFTEASAFVEHKTYVYIEFTLSRPLVPRRKPEELAKRVSEYIPPRPTMKRAVGGAEKAVDDYHSQLSSVATMILDEFRRVFIEPKLSYVLKLTNLSSFLCLFQITYLKFNEDCT